MSDSLKAIAVSSTAAALGVYVYMIMRGKRAPPPPPDYTTAAAWYAKQDNGAKQADCFYAHPTTNLGVFDWNMTAEHRTVCTGIVAGDPCLIKGQASAWAESCNLFAPKYRQMGMLAQGRMLNKASEPELAEVTASLEMAYSDLKAAFLCFLATRPDRSRPFVVAAHSQGAILMSRVLAECVEGTPQQQQFVAAYLCGAYFPMDLLGTVFTSAHACAGPEDVNCIIAYDTRTPAFRPESINHLGAGIGLWPHHLYWLLHRRYGAKPNDETDDVSKPRLQINPATWSARAGGRHLGARLAGAAAAQLPPEGHEAALAVSDKAVIVPDPQAWLPGAGDKGGPGNMHPIDVHFWYENIRQNVAVRIAAWRRQYPARV